LKLFSIKKFFFLILVLSVPSAEVRMRVFELLTALCVYSQDGYELVLKALQDFQVNINFSVNLKEQRQKQNISEKPTIRKGIFSLFYLTLCVV